MRLAFKVSKKVVLTVFLTSPKAEVLLRRLLVCFLALCVLPNCHQEPICKRENVIG